MNHIVDTCPLTKFEGGLNLLHKVDDDAVIQLESTVTAALAKQIRELTELSVCLLVMTVSFTKPNKPFMLLIGGQTHIRPVK